MECGLPRPDDFLQSRLSRHSSYDPHVDKLVAEARATQSTDPAAARRWWAKADRIVTDQAPWVPVFNETSAGFVSSRVGNYQESPEYGPLLDQMWVR